MVCNDCVKFEKAGKIYYLKIEKANIGIIACEKHFSIIKNRMYPTR